MRSLGTNRGIGVAALLIVGLGLFGLAACGSDQAAPPPASGGTTTSQSAQAGLPPAGDDAELESSMTEHHGHQHGGFTHLVIMSVETIGGTPEQHDKIEKVRADLLAKTAPVHEANKNLHSVLADVLADGSASADEQAKVDAAVAQIATAASAAHAATADAMNELHNVLDAGQRTALVEKVEAQWQVWRTANAADDKDNNGLPDAEEKRVVHMTKELSLTPDQVTKIKSGLQAGMAAAPNKLDPAEVDAHVKAWGDAFQKDAFDAKALHGENVNAHLAGSGAARMARFYVVLAPVLTPDQRTKLVANFHKHQNASRNVSGT